MAVDVIPYMLAERIVSRVLISGCVIVLFYMALSLSRNGANSLNSRLGVEDLAKFEKGKLKITLVNFGPAVVFLGAGLALAMCVLNSTVPFPGVEQEKTAAVTGGNASVGLDKKYSEKLIINYASGKATALDGDCTKGLAKGTRTLHDAEKTLLAAEKATQGLGQGVFTANLSGLATAVAQQRDDMIRQMYGQDILNLFREYVTAHPESMEEGDAFCNARPLSEADCNALKAVLDTLK